MLKVDHFLQLPPYYACAREEGQDLLVNRASGGREVHHVPTPGEGKGLCLLRGRLHVVVHQPLHPTGCRKSVHGTAAAERTEGINSQLNIKGSDSV